MAILFPGMRAAFEPPPPYNVYSLYTDGTNQYGTANGAASAIQTDTQGTISLWVKPDNIGATAKVLFCVGNGGATYIQVFSYFGTVRVNGFIGGSQKYILATDAAVLSTSNYTHIAITHNGTEPNIWIDGVDVAASYLVSTDKTPWFNNVGSPFLVRLGANTTGAVNPYPGLMDEVAYFNSVLSSGNISDIANGPDSKTDALNPVLHWRMEEGLGSTVRNDGSDSTDLTLVNSPTFSTDIP